VAGLESLLRFWHAIDATFERVTQAWWGAVVTDSRFPEVWDLNYARVETTQADLTAADIEADLLPAIAESGARHVHVVVFHPEELTGLVTELSTRGDRISWDTAMECVRRIDPSAGDPPVEEVTDFDDAFWARHRLSLREFDVTDPRVADQLVRLERNHLLPNGKRWFTLRDGGEMLAFASLHVLDGVGYLDHVVTFPEARGRGYASALVRRAAAESRAAGATDLLLLAEPDGRARTLYGRLGFEIVGHLAASLRARS
jgi:ribosomal protein S18 acetylase RimI-like enzyme